MVKSDLNSSSDTYKEEKMGKRISQKQRQWRKKTFHHKSDCVVYVVTDDEGQIRYCGQSRCLPEMKRMWIEKGARKNPHTPFHRWFLDYIKTGRKWKIKIVDANATWDVSEVIWIERLRQSGCPLLNVLRGGRDVIQYPVPYTTRRTKVAWKAAESDSGHVADERMRQEHMISIMFES